MDVTKLRPLHDFVLVKREEADEKTPGGIIVPENAKEKLTRGTVVAVGPGKRADDGRRIEPSLKKGDRVVFGKYSGNEMDDKLRALGGSYLIMREEDVVAVLES